MLKLHFSILGHSFTHFSQFLLFLICNLLIFNPLLSQIISVFPEFPNADDSVTITFYADRGNKALMDIHEPVYMHTGIISGTAQHPSEWKHVQGEWGKADSRVQMKKIGQNVYQIRFHIRSFYSIELNEPLVQMAFVFRNKDGSLVGTPSNADEVYYPDLSLLLAKQRGQPLEEKPIFLGNYESYELADHQLILYTDKGSLNVNAYLNDIIQLRYSPNSFLGRFDSQVMRTDTLSSIPLTISEQREHMEVSWGSSYKLIVHFFPLRTQIVKQDKIIFEDSEGCFIDLNTNTAGIRFRLESDEYIYGGGMRALPMNRNGHNFRSYNSAVYAYENGEKNLNISIPFFISANGYGLYVDAWQNGWFDLGKSLKNIGEVGMQGTEGFSYFLFLSDTLAHISSSFAQLSGYQSLPPKWAMGYIQSGFSYQSQEEVRQITDQTLAKGYPLSAIVLNHHWYGGTKKMGTFSWDHTTFPYPANMIQSLRKKGIRLLLNTEPFLIYNTPQFSELASEGLLAQNSGGFPYIIPDFSAGPAGLIDIYEEEAKEWLWDQYKKHIVMGISGWSSNKGEPEKHPYNLYHKSDKTEQVHNLYGLEWARLLSHRYDQELPANRLVNIVRSGFTGMQKYSTFPWSGQVARSWEGLQAQPSIILSMGLQGVPYIHSPIGGFVEGNLDSELYLRWLQFGTFSPIMRTDAIDVPSEPIAFDSLTQRLAQKAIHLRYELLPYNYTLAFKNSQSGIPLAKPLWYNYPADSSTYIFDQAYLWGDEMMVVPILEPKQQKIAVYFPKDTWVDWYKGNAIEGGSIDSVTVEPSYIPTFVKAESLIPTMPVPEQNERLNQLATYGDTLIVHYFSHNEREEARCSQQLYFDDGIKRNTYPQGEFALWELQMERFLHKATFAINSNGMLSLQPHFVIMVWKNCPQDIKKARWGNETIRKMDYKADIFQQAYGMYWDEENQILYISLQRDPQKKNQQLRLRF